MGIASSSFSRTFQSANACNGDSHAPFGRHKLVALGDDFVHFGGGSFCADGIQANDFITYPQVAWGQDVEPGNIAQALHVEHV
jgi:hypothetical protein